MQTLESIVTSVDVFRGMTPEHLALLSGCASNVRYDAGDFPGRAGALADHFWVIREGRLALELPSTGRGPITVATMAEGDVVGFSWLVPPYELQFDIHALTTTRALLFDGRCLRGKCQNDPRLGYELMSRFAGIMADRIQAMSLQLLDVFGDHHVGPD